MKNRFENLFFFFKYLSHALFSIFYTSRKWRKKIWNGLIVMKENSSYRLVFEKEKFFFLFFFFCTRIIRIRHSVGDLIVLLCFIVYLTNWSETIKKTIESLLVGNKICNTSHCLKLCKENQIKMSCTVSFFTKRISN